MGVGAWRIPLCRPRHQLILAGCRAPPAGSRSTCPRPQA